jgi:hypothetical protein
LIEHMDAALVSPRGALRESLSGWASEHSVELA